MQEFSQLGSSENLIGKRMSILKVAVVQHPPVYLNLEESLRRALVLIEEAANAGAELIVFPETWLPGYPVWLDFSPEAALWDHAPAKALYRLLVENSLEAGGKQCGRLADLAEKTGAHLVMGAHERLGGTLYNSMFFFPKDREPFLLHRKLMPTFSERMLWGRGDGSTLGVMQTGFGNIGGLICWEHWMPLARAAMHALDEIIHVAQWPMVKEMNLVASRHYAFEGACFVLAAGGVLSKNETLAGFDSIAEPGNPGRDLLESMPVAGDALLLKGGSAIIAPDGSCVAQTAPAECTILYAELDRSRVTEAKLALDTNGHYARPDVFQLRVNTRRQESVILNKAGARAGDREKSRQRK